MRIFSRLSSVLVMVVAATGFHSSAIAQPASSTQPKPDETLAETFERTFFTNDLTFFRNRSLGRQFNWIFGFNGYTENEINRDAARVDDLYRSSLKRQTSSDPVIRTRDLPNPYETSILASPDINVNQRTRDNELIFEKQ